MSNLLVVDPVQPEDGLDYVFAYMSAAYGSQFIRSFDAVSIDMVRTVWQKELGSYLKSKAILDYALSNLPHDYPPSVFKFRELCKKSPDICDLDTRHGVEMLAQKMGLNIWDQCIQFKIYRNQIMHEAKERGII